MSSIAMAADSTQSLKEESVFKKKKKRSREPKKKKKQKKASFKKEKHGHKKTEEDEEVTSDHEQDLDLSYPLKAISGYVSDREELIQHMFRSISTKKLKGMLPEILRPLPIDELQALCIEQLEYMSKKRIRRLLAGADPETISSSGSEDESSDLAESDTNEGPESSPLGAGTQGDEDLAGASQQDNETEAVVETSPRPSDVEPAAEQNWSGDEEAAPEGEGSLPGEGEAGEPGDLGEESDLSDSEGSWSSRSSSPITASEDRSPSESPGNQSSATNRSTSDRSPQNKSLSDGSPINEEPIKGKTTFPNPRPKRIRKKKIKVQWSDEEDGEIRSEEEEEYTDAESIPGDSPQKCKDFTPHPDTAAAAGGEEHVSEESSDEEPGDTSLSTWRNSVPEGLLSDTEDTPVETIEEKEICFSASHETSGVQETGETIQEDNTGAREGSGYPGDSPGRRDDAAKTGTAPSEDEQSVSGKEGGNDPNTETVSTSPDKQSSPGGDEACGRDENAEDRPQDSENKQEITKPTEDEKSESMLEAECSQESDSARVSGFVAGDKTPSADTVIMSVWGAEEGIDIPLSVTEESVTDDESGETDKKIDAQPEVNTSQDGEKEEQTKTEESIDKESTSGKEERAPDVCEITVDVDNYDIDSDLVQSQDELQKKVEPVPGVKPEKPDKSPTRGQRSRSPSRVKISRSSSRDQVSKSPSRDKMSRSISHGQASRSPRGRVSRESFRHSSESSDDGISVSVQGVCITVGQEGSVRDVRPRGTDPSPKVTGEKPEASLASPPPASSSKPAEESKTKPATEPQPLKQREEKEQTTKCAPSKTDPDNQTAPPKVKIKRPSQDRPITTSAVIQSGKVAAPVQRDRRIIQTKLEIAKSSREVREAGDTHNTTSVHDMKISVAAPGGDRRIIKVANKRKSSENSADTGEIPAKKSAETLTRSVQQGSGVKRLSSDSSGLTTAEGTAAKRAAISQNPSVTKNAATLISSPSERSSSGGKVLPGAVKDTELKPASQPKPKPGKPQPSSAAHKTKEEMALDILDKELGELNVKAPGNKKAVLSQSQMEILELEMRARAIKAMLKTQEVKAEPGPAAVAGVKEEAKPKPAKMQVTPKSVAVVAKKPKSVAAPKASKVIKPESSKPKVSHSQPSKSSSPKQQKKSNPKSIVTRKDSLSPKRSSTVVSSKQKSTSGQASIQQKLLQMADYPVSEKTGKVVSDHKDDKPRRKHRDSHSHKHR